VLRFASEVKGLQCFLQIAGKLADAANDRSLAKPNQTGLKDPRKLAVSKVNELEVLRADLLPLTQFVDYV
jgi:hypothetical protein